MTIIDSTQRFIRDCIINNQFFVRSTDDSSSCRDFRIMEAKSRDVLGSRMRESLQKLVKTSLLQSFDIILHLLIQRQFELIKVHLISGGYSDDLIIVEELSLADLLGKLWIGLRGRG